MSGNFYEDEVRKALQAAMASNRLREMDDSSPFFAQLMTAYPATGSKIDWNRVPDSIERSEEDQALHVEQFIAFFDEMVRRVGLAGDVVYVGDSATDFALAGPIENMREALPDLLTVPQHHYLIGPGSSWCMCFTMEGDMGFGFHPSYTKRH
ncbi:hypothetical protein [Methylocapsa aurea]|uniref:hypothetical protein n=1 Tax=Methylocapsa aurea TaxID=663610 RepID=UPI003D18EA09